MVGNDSPGTHRYRLTKQKCVLIKHQWVNKVGDLMLGRFRHETFFFYLWILWKIILSEEKALRGMRLWRDCVNSKSFNILSRTMFYCLVCCTIHSILSNHKYSLSNLDFSSNAAHCLWQLTQEFQALYLLFTGGFQLPCSILSRSIPATTVNLSALCDDHFRLAVK